MNENTVYVLGALAFFAVFLLFVLFRYMWEANEEKIRARLLKGHVDEPRILVRRDEPKDWAGRIDVAFEDLIRQTGLELQPSQAIAWMIFAGAVLGITGWLIREEFWLAALGFTIGAGLVLGSFFYYYSNYRNMLQDQLPDSFFLLARTLRAGMSFKQAIEMIGRDGIQPLATEFRRCDSQIKLGLPVTAALESMAQRLRMIDINALVSTISIFQSTGGNLPVMLDRLAASARDRGNLRNYFRAATSLSRLSVIPVALVVPMILLVYVLWQPDYVQAFMESPNGWLILLGAIAVELVGLYWIYRLLRFDY